MELTETIRNRRSIRRFKNTVIQKEQIGQLIEAARLCQSAKNRQPWKYKYLSLTKLQKSSVMNRFLISPDILQENRRTNLH